MEKEKQILFMLFYLATQRENYKRAPREIKSSSNEGKHVLQEDEALQGFPKGEPKIFTSDSFPRLYQERKSSGSL